MVTVEEFRERARACMTDAERAAERVFRAYAAYRSEEDGRALSIPEPWKLRDHGWWSTCVAAGGALVEAGLADRADEFVAWAAAAARARGRVLYVKQLGAAWMHERFVGQVRSARGSHRTTQGTAGGAVARVIADVYRLRDMTRTRLPALPADAIQRAWHTLAPETRELVKVLVEGKPVPGEASAEYQRAVTDLRGWLGVR